MTPNEERPPRGNAGSQANSKVKTKDRRTTAKRGARAGPSHSDGPGAGLGESVEPPAPNAVGGERIQRVC
jgi:hypothetical protein